MPVVDFSGWVEPDLVIPLGGVDYTVHPPSVEGLKMIIALAIVFEKRHGLIEGDLSDSVTDAIASIGDTPMAVVSLGQDIYDRMEADGVSRATRARVGLYAVNYWARGKARADVLAHAMWDPDEDEATDDPGEQDPKA